MRSTLDDSKSGEPQAGGPEVIVYGVFKGMGDLLNAAPVILEELNAGNLIKLLVFSAFGLEEFSRLIDFGANRKNLEIIPLPINGKMAQLPQFWHRMKQIRTDLIWISPHAPRPAASWKIPLILWLLKQLCWRQATLAGAESEPLSGLFDARVPVDRDLSLMEREYAAFSLLRKKRPVGLPHPARFIKSIQNHREEAPVFDLLIHPGANAVNRSWPLSHFATLVDLIPPGYQIGVLGLPKDIENAQRILPADRNIQFLTGTLEQALSLIASTRVLLSMDSGNVHFANCLNLPAVALYGKSDPANIIGTWGSVFPIYERKFQCQPCGLAVCTQPEVYCMNSIAPETVAQKLLELLDSTHTAKESSGM